jgi:saccharopine dehydrogenase-like NADP-dependent oxidoreductase
MSDEHHNGDKVSAREFYKAQMATNKQLSKYHGEVKVLIAEVKSIGEQVKENTDDITDIRGGNKVIVAVAGVVGVVSAALADLFGSK